MSIEQTLERVAIALEKQNELSQMLIQGKTGQVVPPGLAVPAQTVVEKKKGTAPKGAPVLAADPVESAFDPFAAEEAEVKIPFEKVTEVLTLHAKKFGAPVTIELMKKHGADKTTPKMKTIPQANWQAAVDEAEAELKKVK